MKTILSLITDIPTSDKHIIYTAKLARSIHANLLLLHVQNPDNYPLGTTGTTGPAVAQLQSNLDELANKAKENLNAKLNNLKGNIPDDLIINTSCEIGISTTIIEQYIKDGKVDMVAIESDRESGFWTPNASNMDIIRENKCPIWIIPEEVKFEPFNDIVYATDYKSEDVVNMKKLLDLANGHSPNITALHITDDVNFEENVKKAGFLDEVRNKTGNDRIDLKLIADDDDKSLHENIINYCDNIGANLIVLLKENRHFLDRVFKTSATKKVIKKSHIPVLVYHEKE